MPPGSERTFELQCVLNAAGDNQVQLLAVAEKDLTATAAVATRVDALADLKLEVRDPQGPVAVGEDAVYEIIIRNRGTKAAEGIDVVSFFSTASKPRQCRAVPTKSVAARSSSSRS